MKPLRALLLLGLLLLPCFARAADSFEGTITMSMSNSSSKKAPQAMTYSVKGGALRIDMKTERGTMGMILDIKNRNLIMLMPQQKMYMVNPFPAPDSAAAAKAAADVSIKDTGVRETILGYSCQKYEVATEHGTTEMWLAPDLRGFENMYAGRQMGSAQIPERLQAIIKNGGGFPMKVVSNLKDGSSMTMLVTAINPEKLSDDLFVPPADFHKFDMAGLINAARGGSGN